MSERTDRDYLAHIREAVKRTALYTEKMTYEEFLGDIKTQDAVVRNIEIIGEAVKNLSEETRNRYTEIQWKNLAGMDLINPIAPPMHSLHIKPLI